MFFSWKILNFTDVKYAHYFCCGYTNNINNAVRKIIIIFVMWFYKHDMKRNNNKSILRIVY